MIDLHCHTTASDGLMTPYEIIKHAIQKRLCVLAIADHDSVNGLDEAIQAADELGICFIPAIELSADFPIGDFHLLGYGIDYKKQDFIMKLSKLRSIREERVPRIIERLNKVKIELTLEDVKEVSKDAVPGRPHIARALVRKGYVSDVDAAIKKYLIKGMPGYVHKEKLDIGSAFKLISSVGGIPVLAHPKSLKCKDCGEYVRLIESFLPYGLAGIEVYASIHEDVDVEMFAEIAKHFNLFVTGGSDFHGDNGERLGYYGDNRTIPESCALSILQIIKSR